MGAVVSYVARIVDALLAERLASVGAVLIEGARATGKTETGLRSSSSHVFLDTDQNARRLVELDPALLLDGSTPRLLDEWQLAPELWNFVRRAVDQRARPGQFILTGSATPADDHTRHSGAGRFSRLRMRPLSMAETGDSDSTVSLADLLMGQTPKGVASELSLQAVARRIVHGGWPSTLGSEDKVARRFAVDYLDQVSRVDVGGAGKDRHDPTRVASLLRSLARNAASEVSVSTLAADAGGAHSPLHRDTVARYLDALERIFILEQQPAWPTHLRSKAVLRGAPKRHLVDTSLCAAALGVNAERLVLDPQTFGILFESLVFAQLQIYSQPLDGVVSHYRDSNGAEVDSIVSTSDGSWAAFEVKLSPNSIDAAARSLLRFVNQVDTGRVGQPKTLGVITATGYGYRRADGIVVIPIGALGP